MLSNKEFSALRKEIYKPENLIFRGEFYTVYKDRMGRIFRLEDDGYTEVIVLPYKTFIRNFENTIEEIDRR